MKDNKPISDEVIRIVVNRLDSIPRNVEITIGDIEIGGTYTVDELIQRVKDQDEVGRQMVEVQMNYLRSFSDKYASPAAA